ncbi:hypothetical protein [Desulfomonile tiedjei]|uniref:Uncharacterized protein n=1 Tax=Desulfomonile tiedjei (strain ATCC 49306 / DSM 6799 / DCB-1) TaxID=706587 RepID=I4CAV9_DESTA|nr:hypothetical protein [Desulfomonile tiedjei]AFM26700.1 hypothetical protein Desti_4061 [Desulfomonile tiedjei DSM 6799]
MVDKPDKPLIPSRVLLLGEQSIPQELLDTLEDAHLQIFMREPDPALWPREMEALVQYIAPRDRIAFDLSKIMPLHDSTIVKPLQNWAQSVLNDLSERNASHTDHSESVLEEMLKYLEGVLVQGLNRSRKI